MSAECVLSSPFEECKSGYPHNLIEKRISKLVHMIWSTGLDFRTLKIWQKKDFCQGLLHHIAYFQASINPKITLKDILLQSVFEQIKILVSGEQ